jgi:hypothetical protein
VERESCGVCPPTGGASMTLIKQGAAGQKQICKDSLGETYNTSLVGRQRVGETGFATGEAEDSSLVSAGSNDGDVLADVVAVLVGRDCQGPFPNPLTAGKSEGENPGRHAKEDAALDLVKVIAFFLGSVACRDFSPALVLLLHVY